MTTRPKTPQGDPSDTTSGDAPDRLGAGQLDGPARRLDLSGLSPAEVLDRLSRGVTLGGLSLRELIGRDRD